MKQRHRDFLKPTHSKRRVKGDGDIRWSSKEQESAIVIACKLRDDLFSKLAEAGHPKPDQGVIADHDLMQMYEAAECLIAEKLAEIVEWRLNRKGNQQEKERKQANA